jgi:hypothetical protein
MIREYINCCCVNQLLKNIISVAYVEEQVGFFHVDHEYLQYIHISICVFAQ